MSDETNERLSPPEDLDADVGEADADLPPDDGPEDAAPTDELREPGNAKGTGAKPKPFARPLTLQEHQFCHFYVRQGEGTKVAPAAYRQAFGAACEGQRAIKISMRAYALLQQPAIQREVEHQRALMLEDRDLFDQKMREASFDKVAAIRNLEYESFAALWRALKFHSNWVAKGKVPLATGTKAIELGMKVTGNLKTDGPIAQITVTPEDVKSLDAEIEKLVGERRNALSVPADAPIGNPEGQA